jgi:hypothetical protein
LGEFHNVRPTTNEARLNQPKRFGLLQTVQDKTLPGANNGEANAANIRGAVYQIPHVTMLRKHSAVL